MKTEFAVRPLEVEDLPAAWQLRRHAFGGAADAPARALELRPGQTHYGAFDRRGHLVGAAIDLHHEQWWGGRAIGAADVAGVAVAPEARGQGVAGALLGAIVRGGHERGAAISALFPTASAPYRSSGWEVVGQLRTVDLPTAGLRATPLPPGLRPRDYDAGDGVGIVDVYERVVRHRTGFLTRRGPLFYRLAEGLPPGIDGITVIERADSVVGYASWVRGRGSGPDAVLTVYDVLALDRDAAAALVGLLHSWRSVTPTLRLRPVVGDALSTLLPLELAHEHEKEVFMHRPVDVVAAVAGRGWPAHVRGRTAFSLLDPIAEWNSGSWVLDVADGRAELTRSRIDTAAILDVRGFALLYAGVATAVDVFQAGLASGPQKDVAALDLLAAGPSAQILDYF